MNFADEIHKTLDKFRRQVEKRVLAHAREYARVRAPHRGRLTALASAESPPKRKPNGTPARACKKCGKPGHYANNKDFHPGGRNGNRK